MRDGEVFSSLDVSETLNKVPVVSIDYVFADRSLISQASGWMKSEKAKVIRPGEEVGRPMDRLRRAAILMRLIEKLREQGSWCGETHVQKATFFLQELMQVPLGFDFLLYKHGPFSFDLRDGLTGLRADDLLALEPHRPYGPRMALTNRSDYIQRLFSKTLDNYDPLISFVAENLGPKDVIELERLATALYVTKRAEVGLSADTRADLLTELKPHIPREIAVRAVEAADRMIKEAERYPD
jgi:hypothetical protein